MSLPEETLLNIALNLQPKELLNLCRTSSQYASLCEDDYLWKLLSERDYGVTSLPYYAESWKQYYVQAYTDANKVYYISLEEGREDYQLAELEEAYWQLYELIQSFSQEYNLSFELLSVSSPLDDISISDDTVTYYFTLEARFYGLTKEDVREYAREISDLTGITLQWGEVNLA